jgi:hypothetical protein
LDQFSERDELKNAHLHPSDLRGYARLATQATTGLADLVEAMHDTIARPLASTDAAKPRRTGGVTGLVYGSVRGVTRLVGGGLDAVLSRLRPTVAELASSREREATLAALNGVLGDYLEGTGNPLAIAMSLRRAGRVISLEDHALCVASTQNRRRTHVLDASSAQPDGKIVVLVHGLCMNDLQWQREGRDHGAVIERELGYAPVYLHYNSGLHTSSNGELFAGLLEELVARWPHRVRELVILAHSMGGLVARSAIHLGREAGYDWPRLLRKLVFLGTPHHGAPLERGGSWVDLVMGATRFTAPFRRLGMIRSAGITDLRYGNVLEEHWQGRDRFAHSADTRRHLPLPRGVRCFAIAASTASKPHVLRDRLVGDGLVPVRSALGQHRDPARSLAFPRTRQWIGYRMNHLDLLSSADVSQRITDWLRPPAPGARG